MNKIINSILIILFFGLVACESAEDLSNKLDHQVPECKSLTLSSNGQKVIVNDSIVNLLLWGVVPQINLETVVLPTITVKAGVTIEISVEISDNVGLKTAGLSYSSWLFSKYINFANPEGDIPLNPSSYTFTAQVEVPENAIATPWLENYYFNDGSLMKITQSYHKLELTVVDVNMNVRTTPIYVKVE